MARTMTIPARKDAIVSETEVANSGKKTLGRPAVGSRSGGKPAGKASKANTAKGNAAETQSVVETSPATETKASIILRKLNSAKGVTIAAMMEATNWQAHSVHGFLSAIVRKKLGSNLISDTGKDGVRRYRIEADGKSG